MKSLFYAFVFCCAVSSAVSAEHEQIAYKDKRIDLISYPITSLYVDGSNSLMGESLDVQGIFNNAQKKSNIWRLKLAFSLENKPNRDVWLQLRSNVSASRVFLNQHLIAENGVIGTSKKTEKSGIAVLQRRMPDEFLLLGKNTIEVQFSNFNNLQGVIFRDLILSPYQELQQHIDVMTIAPIFFAAIFLMAAFINTGLFFALDKKLTFLCLACMFVLNFTLVTYDIMYWNGLTLALTPEKGYFFQQYFELLIYVSLLAALYFELGANRRQLVVLVSGLMLTILIENFFGATSNVLVSLTPLVFTLGLKGRELRTNKLLVASLLLVFLFNLADKLDWLDNLEILYTNVGVTSFVYKIDHFGMVIIAITMLTDSIKNILIRSQALHSAKFHIERLEYQFLQKHIQPHFLMNTLMSLQQLIQSKPVVAIEVIDELAEEFKLLNDMSKSSLVHVSQEIRICQIHLKIMSIQQQAMYSLDVKGIQYDEEVPPAIFHTLVENGLTHGFSGSENANFWLTKTIDGQKTQYRLANDGKSLDKLTHPLSTGTGLKYVESRLQEWSPNDWKLESKATDTGWETIIEINS